MKIFSIGTGWASLRRKTRDQGDCPDWISDPLSHPDVDAMTERELGDLPFNRGYRGAPEGAVECCN
jgi:hypothetical protein